MFDSDEEFEASCGQGPNKAVGKFLAALPASLRDTAVPLANFTKANFLGRGTFGRVYKGTAPDGSSVALKKLSLHQFNNQRHALALKDSVREVQVLASLQHRNIAQLRHVALGISDVYLAIELCPVQVLQLVEVDLPPAVIKSLTWQLLTGLRYVHGRGLIHRDVKTDNLMLKQGTLKIGDFGSAASVDQKLWTPQVVTLWYRPPEILLGCPLQTCAIDIWSAGCVVAELLLGEVLFRGHSELSQINRIVDLLGTPTSRDWPGLSDLPVMECMSLNERERRFERELAPVVHTTALLRLLARMFAYNPEGRLTADECLAADYFGEQPPMATEIEVDTFCTRLSAKLERALESNSDDDDDEDDDEGEECDDGIAHAYGAPDGAGDRRAATGGPGRGGNNNNNSKNCTGQNRMMKFSRVRKKLRLDVTE